MKNIVAKGTLQSFWEVHRDCEQHLKSWYVEVKKADWNGPTDVKATYPTASILKTGRVVFNIKGNAYRLIASINYKRQWVYIRFIGTHFEYDRVDANLV
jgi:mRNA interferase HigB